MFTTTDSPDPRDADPADPGRGRRTPTDTLPIPGAKLAAAGSPVHRPRHTPVGTPGTAPGPTGKTSPTGPTSPTTAVPVAAPTPRTLLVPVGTTASGTGTLRLFRDPLGRRVAVGFTSIARLRGACGPDQQWVRLAETCLRETLAGLGVAAVLHDPRLVAASPTRTAAEHHHD
ncbi:MAG: hypothetical protein HOU01_14655 [Streptomycetaceae bacterium]|nr:hypothetical protein [Streptomycetaceae bacterium]